MIKWIQQKLIKWKAKKILKRIDDTIDKLTFKSGQTIPQALPTSFTFSQEVDYNILTLSNDDGPIFKIDANGNAQWCNEATYDEVAEVFLNCINFKIESEAGIQESRKDWEAKIADAITKESEKQGGTLTTEQLTNVVKKCIMVDRLKGMD